MKLTVHRNALIAAFAAAIATSTSAQSVLFDFNTAPLHSPLPIDLTVSGITAHFSGTGQGYSIQDTSAPVAPVGFTGRFIYPSSIYAADLLISFDQTLAAFSILYSPQELACDDSATMRVTANMNGSFVGTNTKTASNPGTWPVDTLSCSFPQGFNSVVVHYDSRPPTCQDYGVIFLADDMRVTALTNAGTPYCFGDGTGTACPCNNNSAVGANAGCRNSLGTAGLLTSSGTPSVSADTFMLLGSGMPNSSALYFQGTAQSSTVFGDGLRCAGGTEIRLGTKTNIAGASHYPVAGDQPISVRGANVAGGVREYQCWYRNPAPFCTSSTFNLTNGWLTTWMP